jgi:hypothetical protein
MGVDCALMFTSEEELGGVSFHVELIIGGDNFEAIINDILVEDGGAGFFVSIAESAKPWVYSWHWATRCQCACFFMVLIF